KTRIQVGSTLKVAPAGAKVAAAPQTEPAAPAGDAQTHVVRAGEFPAKIAKQYGVDLNEFLAWNSLDKDAMIRVGDRLVVRGKPAQTASAAAPAPREPEKSVYKVQPGDSASVIAEKHGVGLSELLKWNKLSRNTTLKVGTELVLYTSGAPDAPAKEEVVVHRVAKGQNPTTIARRYGVSVNDLLRWNGWDKNRVLRVGDTVTIRQN
ncbi:MAG TPA: LysM peptidoglycan-binding domain-containing protein, partial [Candidatus Hydrogenedentes bacterium]|nr:LysM peptidoglycan-binding domain-containing protein [Candidatus Hydrogenedentota bacterium]